MGKPKIYLDTLETTLVLIKPDGLPFQNKILKKFYNLGFRVLAKKYIQFSPEQAAEFYHEYEKRQYFSLLILNLTKGITLALILTKENILMESLVLLTPHWQKANMQKQSKSICFYCVNKHFGNCNLDYKNFVHCSIGPENAKRELNYVFPNFLVEQTGPKYTSVLCSRHFIKIFIDGLFFVTENATDDPITKLAQFLLDNNSNLPIIEYETKKSEYPCREAECAAENRRESEIEEQPLTECASSDVDVPSSISDNTCLCFTCSTSSYHTECSIDSEITNKTDEMHENKILPMKAVEIEKIEEEKKIEVVQKSVSKKKICKKH